MSVKAVAQSLPASAFQTVSWREGTNEILSSRFATLRATIPRSGTPLLVDGIAIVRGTRRADAARAYYEFVTARPAMLEAAAKFLRIPARTDLPADSLPEWIRAARREIRPMPLDRRLLAEHLDEWMTYWDSHIRNRGRQ